MIPLLPETLDSPVADYMSPYPAIKKPLVDYHRGGVALNDASKGLDIQNWKIEVRDNKVYISGDTVAESEIPIDIPDGNTIEWISLAFDQNMHYVVAYSLDNNDSYLYYFNLVTNTNSSLPLGKVNTPIVRMDDVRFVNSANNDIILSYVRDGKLICRIQKDKYEVEYELSGSVSANLLQCGITTGSRFQWFTREKDPTLANIVTPLNIN